MSFDFAPFTREGVAQSPRWTGSPPYNFVGGNNDEASVPVDALRAAADAVLAREGRTLGAYFMRSGPLGYRPLREVLAAKLKRHAAMEADPDEILLTSGSLQAIDLVNSAMLERGDTVIVEESNYGGVFPRLDRLGVEQPVVRSPGGRVVVGGLFDGRRRRAQRGLELGIRRDRTAHGLVLVEAHLVVLAAHERLTPAVCPSSRGSNRPPAESRASSQSGSDRSRRPHRAAPSHPRSAWPRGRTA